MTSLNLNYISIIIPVAFFIIPCWDLIRDSEKRGLHKITKLGWVMLIFALIAGCLSASTIYVASKEKDKADSTEAKMRRADKKEILGFVNDAFKTHQASFNPITKTIVKLVERTDTIKTFDTTKSAIIHPVMDLSNNGNNKNPIFLREGEITYFSVYYAPINNGVGFNIKSQRFYIKKIGVNFYFGGTISGKSSTLEAVKGKESFAKFGFGLPENNIYPDTMLVYLKVSFTSNQESTRLEPLFRRYFYVVFPNKPNSIEDYPIVHPVESTKLSDDFESYLIKNQYY